MSVAQNAGLEMMSRSNSNDVGWMLCDKMLRWMASCRWLNSFGTLTFSSLKFKHCSSVCDSISKVLFGSFVLLFSFHETHNSFFNNDQLLNKNSASKAFLSLPMFVLHVCYLQSHAWSNLRAQAGMVTPSLEMTRLCSDLPLLITPWQTWLNDYNMLLLFFPLLGLWLWFKQVSLNRDNMGVIL